MNPLSRSMALSMGSSLSLAMQKLEALRNSSKLHPLGHIC
ncbi:Uncharacterised protein [uncultured archaeon]|nr:Uncharacterised protein [uncultured archaeon]